MLDGLDLRALRIEREELCGIHADVTAAISAEAGELLACGDREGLCRMEEIEREVWERLVLVEQLLRVN